MIQSFVQSLFPEHLLWTCYTDQGRCNLFSVCWHRETLFACKVIGARTEANMTQKLQTKVSSLHWRWGTIRKLLRRYLPNASLEQVGVGTRGNKSVKGRLPEVINRKLGNMGTQVGSHRRCLGPPGHLDGKERAPCQVGWGPVILTLRDPNFPKPFFNPRRDLHFFQPSLTKASRWQQTWKPNTPVLSWCLCNPFSF